MRRAAPSKVMRGPRGVAKGPKPAGSSTRISRRASNAAPVASRALAMAHSGHRVNDHDALPCPGGATRGGGRQPLPCKGQ
eukprot:726954-Alexandrium_andersonii.AAC.1